MSLTRISGTNYQFNPATLEILHQDVTAVPTEPCKLKPARAGKTVFAIQLLVTSACNLKCQYCFADTRFGADSVMDSATVSRVAEFVRRAADKYGMASVNFFGGEPLLNPAAIEQLIGELEGCDGIAYALTTNGTLLDETVLKLLKKCRANVCVSLDGPQHIHDAVRRTRQDGGSFDGAVEAIHRVVDAGLICSVECVVDLDQPKIAEQFEYLRTLPLKKIQMSHNYYYDYPMTPDRASEYIEQLSAVEQAFTADLQERIHQCYFLSLGPCFGSDTLSIIHNMSKGMVRCGTAQCAIAPDGTVYRCPALIGEFEFYRGRTPELPEPAPPGGRSEVCNDCWAVSLCGGLCDYQDLIYRDRGVYPDPGLCLVYRELCQASLRTYLAVRENAWEVLAYLEQHG